MTLEDELDRDPRALDDRYLLRHRGFAPHVVPRPLTGDTPREDLTWIGSRHITDY